MSEMSCSVNTCLDSKSDNEALIGQHDFELFCTTYKIELVMIYKKKIQSQSLSVVL